MAPFCQAYSVLAAVMMGAASYPTIGSKPQPKSPQGYRSFRNFARPADSIIQEQKPGPLQEDVASNRYGGIELDEGPLQRAGFGGGGGLYGDGLGDNDVFLKGYDKYSGKGHGMVTGSLGLTGGLAGLKNILDARNALVHSGALGGSRSRGTYNGFGARYPGVGVAPFFGYPGMSYPGVFPGRRFGAMAGLGDIGRQGFPSPGLGAFGGLGSGMGLASDYLNEASIGALGGGLNGDLGLNGRLGFAYGW